MPNQPPTRPQEVPLSLTFGDDTSPAAFRSFHTHYNLVKEANIMRGVTVWTKPDYRAVVLRLQLRGSTAAYVEQQVQLDAEWGRNDTNILDCLSSRFITAEAIEIRILHFEEAAQSPGEGLSDFMTRLQQLAAQAFAKEPSDIVRKRVIWRFLDGIRDKEVRLHIIQEKWMENDESAKSYSAVLKIAEAALSAKNATSATGQAKSATVNVEVAQATVERNDEAPVMINRGAPGQVAAVRQSTPSTPTPAVSSRGKYTQQGPNRVVECYYCSKTHAGGWRACYRRLRENPSWRPRTTRQDFQ